MNEILSQYIFKIVFLIIFSFSSPKTTPKPSKIGAKKATLEIRKKGEKSRQNIEKREYVLEENLPLEYNIGGNDVLSAPDLLCHLSNPKTQQYHVTRYDKDDSKGLKNFMIIDLYFIIFIVTLKVFFYNRVIYLL